MEKQIERVGHPAFRNKLSLALISLCTKENEMVQRGPECWAFSFLRATVNTIAIAVEALLHACLRIALNLPRTHIDALLL